MVRSVHVYEEDCCDLCFTIFFLSNWFIFFKVVRRMQIHLVGKRGLRLLLVLLKH